MRKKLFASILSAALMLSSVTVFAAGGTLVLEVGSTSESIEAGKSFDVEVKATQNPGYVTGSVIIGWESSALELTAVKYNNSLAPNGGSPAITPSVHAKGEYQITFGDDINWHENVSQTGTFFTLSFKITDSAQAGTYPITIKGVNSSFMDVDMEDISFEGKNGSITLSGGQSSGGGGGGSSQNPSGGGGSSQTPSGGGSSQKPSDNEVDDKPAVNPPDNTVEKPSDTPKPVQPSASKTFSDVAGNAWYKSAVDYVVSKGIMSGTGGSAFEPNTNLTRAMLVAILYRMEGSPSVSAKNSFNDVEKGQWYTNPVIWANSKGIVSGYGEGKFGPADKITREQMASILMRYAKFKGIDTSKRGDLSKFTDVKSVSDWAKDSVAWANSAGLISGRTKTTLVPQGNTTRAEAASILMRFMENIAK